MTRVRWLAIFFLYHRIVFWSIKHLNEKNKIQMSCSLIFPDLLNPPNQNGEPLGSHLSPIQKKKTCPPVGHL